MDDEDSDSLLLYKIRHFFLPIRLPHRYDGSSKKDQALVAHITQSGRQFLSNVKALLGAGDPAIVCWERVVRMLENFGRLNPGEGVAMDAELLKRTVNNMTTGDVLPIYVAAQNAGAILRKPSSLQLTYESIFASLPTGNVTTTTGKVVAQFPTSPRLPMPAEVDLIDILCGYLAEMHTLEFPDAVPKTQKAGKKQAEYRESTHPYYVTEFLPSIVRSFSADMGNVRLPRTVYVTKRLGDHVLWKNAKLPWRRTPVLLVLKVALQTTLLQLPSQYGYKAFMAFTLCRMLSEATRTRSVSHDLLHFMNAKVTRRVYKLRTTTLADNFPVDVICRQSESTAHLLQESWKAIQREEATPVDLTPPSEAEINDSQLLSLKNSRAYLDSVITRDETLQRTCSAFDAAQFEATLSRSLRLNGSSPPHAFDSGAALPDILVAMHDMSTWLESDRPRVWMQATSALDRRDTIRSLVECSTTALSRFMKNGADSNPELFSIAFLNVMDLWVILDKTATEAMPLLLQYLPELTLEPLESLLLRSKPSMQRLNRIEHHISDRITASAFGSVYVLDPQRNCRDAIGARYANDDLELRCLRTKIEQAASSDRNAKLAELRRLEDTRQSLLSRADQLSCQYDLTRDYWGIESTVHSGGCRRCSLQRQARDLSIRVFEEPLPANTHLAAAMVFELQVPPLFSLWRSTTLRLLKMFARTLGSPERAANHVLSNYTSLQQSMFGEAAGRCDPHVTLASDHKSCLVAHYNTVRLPCSEDQVLQNHGPRWWLYDASSGYLPQNMPVMDLRSHCTPDSLPGPYARLSWAVAGTTHTPNQVVASQSDCATELSLHEWEAFGHLRAGNRLQWHNIVTQLETAILKIAEPAIHVLIRQASLQVEERSSGSLIARDAHVPLVDEQFALQALDALRHRLLACEENWEEAWTASTLSLVGHRLYELLPPPSPVRCHVRAFLQSALRRACMKWIHDISAAMRKTGPDTSPHARTDLCHRLIQACVAARDTYHVHDRVFLSANAVSDYLECSLVLHQQLPPQLSKLPVTLRNLVQNDVELSISLFHPLLEAINNNGNGIDEAIRRTWPGFVRRTDTSWHHIPSTHWVTCRTSTRGGMQSRTVHVNLLNGSIYVDGASFQALPTDILHHPLYQEIFPSQYQMQILPSTMAGMTYQSQFAHEGHEIHFLMHGKDLVIRIRDPGDQVSEFVPQNKLQGDIPNVFLVQCIAVYRADAVQLDFIPRHEKLGWDPAIEKRWTLYNLAVRPELVSVSAQPQQVICPHSGIARRISHTLSSLESSPLNLLITVSASKQKARFVVTQLPRYRMEFRFDKCGQLASKEFPDHVVSNSCAIGTLCGIEKLVLRRREGPAHQRVLIPHGHIDIVPQSSGHPRITISPSSDPAAHIEAHVFEVDSLVGQVKPYGSLESWLMLAYLHALSSSHQRDPLTDERGVDRALRMLQSASSFAFTSMSTQVVDLLRQITALTPIRQYYPKHLRVMETTQWISTLSPLTQSDLFAPLVEQIVTFALRRAVFDPSSGTSMSRLPAYDGAERLRVRAIRRSALVSPYTAETTGSSGNSTSEDTLFVSAGQSTPDNRQSDVLDIAYRVRTWDLSVDVTPKLWNHFTAWSSFSSAQDDFPLSRPCRLSAYSSAAIWFTLYKQCIATSAQSHKYSLMFTLGFLTYGKGLDDDLIRTALGLAIHAVREQRVIASADRQLLRTAFNVDNGWDMSPPQVKKLEDLIRQHVTPFDKAEEHRLPRQTNETPKSHKERCQQAYREHLDQQVNALRDHLSRQWPSSPPQWPHSTTAQYGLLKMVALQERVFPLFKSMFENRQLRQHASELQLVLDAIRGQRSFFLRGVPSPPSFDAPVPLYEAPTLFLLMATRRAPSEGCMRIRAASMHNPTTPFNDSTVVRLESPVHILIRRVTVAEGFGSRYRRDLGQCADALVEAVSPGAQRSQGFTRLVAQEIAVPALLQDDVTRTFRPSSLFEQALHAGGNWPSLGVLNVMSHLSFSRRHKVSDPWKRSLTLFAQSLVRLQREQRLDLLYGADFDKELSTDVGQGYDVHAYPDWLLVQLDSQVTIRPVQADIAQRMISPHNRVMQLNMGEGKSSVIIPITSTACADGQSLACVVVLKPLCAQMFHLLSQRICGLANRRLFYLPFSRDTPITSDSIRAIGRLFQECAEVGGVLLCQPEHLLSFQLMGSSMLCGRGVDADTRSLLDTQQWLSDHSRYILDESDEILSHKYQLIYTNGSPGPLEGQPERWLVIQQVLSLINASVDAVTIAHPEGLDVELGCSVVQQFRRMRILTQPAYEHLMALCLDKIVHFNAIPLLPFRSYPSKELHAARQFISTLDVSVDAAQALEAYSGDSYPHLLLLRGLFAHGILGLAFKEKRWRVDYGLDLSRSRLAVPYRAKDSPALRAEFGHPDVILTLTSLAYYYGGLQDTELDTAFDRLLTTDNPALRYEYWIKGLELPPNLRTLKGINLKDASQRCNVIYPTLRRVKSVVDFYLSECVFPKEARQFEHKLTTNPWDLARCKGRPTTGFSGTNDNKYMLPTSIVQEDLPSQLHTNALVLSYVLRPENRTVICKDCDASGIIAEAVQSKPHVSVILDVGAQVLELDNAEMAYRWLEQDTREGVDAAVYFGGDDELYVRTRDGRVEQLRRSFYRDQLGKTLVYLDEAHTRGTDLKLPEGTRALVTLGPKLTKDKLMQGCMRMRKLGRSDGHSVLFLASSEIQTRIQESIKEPKEHLDSSDVLVWTMQETIRQTMENGALWANQGLNFDVRQAGWDAYNKKTLDADGLARVLLEREAHPLRELYGPRDVAETTDGVKEQTERQRDIFERCEQFGFAISHSSRLLEEQERELAHEKETEREIQRAPPAKPKPHSVDPKLAVLMQTGTCTLTGFRTLRDCLAVTSVHRELGLLSASFFQRRNVVATLDFIETIELSPKASHEKNGFIRPVHWIVSMRKAPDALVLISPFEANEIINDVRQSRDVRLHIYTPRVSRNMRAFDDMTFLITPSSAAATYAPLASAVLHELNLFAGTLFLRDEAAYREVCQLLGLYLGEIPDALKGQVGVDGFVRDAYVRTRLDILGCRFRRSPTAVLRTLVDLRRKGQGFLLTHIGQMLYGNAVASDEF
ncbi:hypothetical protein BD626DRAFT_461059 [Schizophyllum amplum]|uniref:ubiquitinyl hydrolase 1 n=1 Tax=Schizophyllum amplum TaxID=97359 RepID=A0A550C786_9AGAR|nr:hypothetical protein BD626DRAFT_461059 [Auriculariopsis ampla]